MDKKDCSENFIIFKITKKNVYWKLNKESHKWTFDDFLTLLWYKVHTIDKSLNSNGTFL